ncbi:MAG: xanthine dehydrogenase family protein molybdopterin-binding subunit, partial [Vicinamibacterales bacterium]
MVATEQRQKLIGQRMKRKEDPRFITGAGRYVEDIVLPRMLHAAILRPPYAHAKINSISTSRAASMPGVVAVYTGHDIELPGLPYAWQAAGVDNNVNTQNILAKDEVHWAGDGVAVVVAETIGAAYDALDAIEVDYTPLPTVVDAEKAVQSGAPQLHENAPNNIVFDWTCGNKQNTDQAISSAEVVASGHIRNQRLIATPIETRGSICDYNVGTEEFTFYMTSQAPHVHRLVMAAFVLGVPEQNIRVIAPDIGGGFGSKIFLYADQVLVGWLSRKLGRPVKWIERRSDAHLAMAQGRDHVTDFEIAATRDGKVTGLRVKTLANMGAYLSTASGGIPTTLYGRMVAGVYAIPNIHVNVLGVYTNTT